jgi:hypothetical protein
VCVYFVHVRVHFILLPAAYCRYVCVYRSLQTACCLLATSYCLLGYTALEKFIQKYSDALEIEVNTAVQAAFPGYVNRTETMSFLWQENGQWSAELDGVFLLLGEDTYEQDQAEQDKEEGKQQLKVLIVETKQTVPQTIVADVKVKLQAIDAHIKSCVTFRKVPSV